MLSEFADSQSVFGIMVLPLFLLSLLLSLSNFSLAAIVVLSFSVFLLRLLQMLLSPHFFGWGNLNIFIHRRKSSTEIKDLKNLQDSGK